jgi:hypothetical protein
LSEIYNPLATSHSNQTERPEDSRSIGNPELNGPIWQKPDWAAFLLPLAFGGRVCHDQHLAARLWRDCARGMTSTFGGAGHDHDALFRAATGVAAAYFQLLLV